MSSLPLLSIIIPLYNAAPFVEMAVKSVFRQNFQDSGGATEIIIVNDGSSDGSGEIARRLANQHREIQVIDQENQGVSAARNAGIRRARGDVLIFMDADDEYAEGALAFLLQELKALRQTYGERVMVRAMTQYLRRSPSDGNWHIAAPAVTLASVTAGAQTRATVESVGFFDEELHSHEDLDWLLRAEEQGIVMPILSRAVLLYRQHESSLTRDVASAQQERIKMLKKSIQRKHARRVQSQSGGNPD